MRPTLIITLLVAGGLAASAAMAAPAARHATASASAKPPVTRSARGAHTPSVTRNARGAQTPPGMPRTLQDVNIEGEIPVPQVLFITTREPRRFMDFQHHRYLQTSVQLGEQTAVPTGVAIAPVTPNDPEKETSR